MNLIEVNKGFDFVDWSVKRKGKGKDKKINKGGDVLNEIVDIVKIIRMIVKKKFQLVIVFNFSKWDCEQMVFKSFYMKFNVFDEEFMVDKVFENVFQQLLDEDKNFV